MPSHSSSPTSAQIPPRLYTEDDFDALVDGGLERDFGTLIYQARKEGDLIPGETTGEDVCHAHGLTRNVLYQRLCRGMPLEQALTAPLSNQGTHRENVMARLAKEAGVTVDTLYRRMREGGMTLEEAVAADRQTLLRNRRRLPQKITVNGQSVPEFAASIGKHPVAVYRQLRAGMTPEQIVAWAKGPSKRLKHDKEKDAALAACLGLKPSTIRRLHREGLTDADIAKRREEASIVKATSLTVMAKKSKDRLSREGIRQRIIKRGMSIREAVDAPRETCLAKTLEKEGGQ